MKTGTIHHHISDALLLEYASGGLEESWSLAVATHLALCPHCRARLRLMEAAGGALMEEAEPETAKISEDASWAALQARLKATDVKAAAKPAPAAPGAALIPEPLRSYVGATFDDVPWRRLGLYAHQALLQTEDKGIQVRLLRVDAGKPLPEHSHGGRELTLVLHGSFTSEGQTFGPGDFEEEDEDTIHQPVVGPESECICLAVTDAPLRFQSRFMRVLQPLLDI
ncbi:ChrR family anti-sigma-E factor [Martelella mediterranea]|uniref:ChrR family anti-sigma-E factor n=1 Tax=Martelella mediterranea TaxID=293089 RepID=UPI001E4790B5|nr:ChrR family anti-sigma-E factor [Martelella mediterranea]MCD1635997.1 ChrR family anti-sigma-E factor [Martelella mediterranea]